jgi:hypothetical protein
MINRGDYFGTGLDYSEKINPFDEFGLRMATYWREKEFYLVEYIGNKKQIIQISKIIKEITNVTLPTYNTISGGDDGNRGQDNTENS